MVEKDEQGTPLQGPRSQEMQLGSEGTALFLVRNIVSWDRDNRIAASGCQSSTAASGISPVRGKGMISSRMSG